MVPKKKADNFIISSLDHVLHPLLGINKAHLNKVENSPGSSFCSAAAHSAAFHATGAHCHQLFPLLQLVEGPPSLIKSLPLYVNTKLQIILFSIIVHIIPSIC